MKGRRFITFLGGAAVFAAVLASPSYAQSTDVATDAVIEAGTAITPSEVNPVNAPSYDINAVANTDDHQDFCISVITGFPNDNQVSRYQFFKLTQDLSVDATSDFRQALISYQDDSLPRDIPVLDVIEIIANPVLRQAAPEIVVASMYHLIDFNHKCTSYVGGQIASLTAYDNALTESDIVIAEDALYLRQILLDSLSRLGANNSPIHGVAMGNYSTALVRARDTIEFAAYEGEVSDLESLFMEDLDGRLAKSNDIINNEIDREILGDAVTLSDDLIDDLRRKQKEEDLRTLARILNGF